MDEKGERREIEIGKRIKVGAGEEGVEKVRQKN